MKTVKEARPVGSKGYQFGTFKGVYTPSVLTILGVVMYLRFGWVLGNVGLAKTLLIASMSTAITFMTGLSLSALATNRKVEGGGAYYIISRSLGVEAGAAVGIPLFFAQALGISFYTAGFAESVSSIFPQFSPLIVGSTTLVIMTILAYISADLALKSQFIIMSVMVLSLVSFFLGHDVQVSLPTSAVVPDIKPFWYVFAVFFPAVTGIEAGIAMSGDLKDPAKSLPRGTIAAILTGYAIYIAVPVFIAVKVSDLSILRHESMSLVMSHIARWGKLVVMGIWAASLSSALGSLLGAPRTLQALAKDRVVPRIFGRGWGKGNDPRIATATAFLIGLAGILLGGGNLNAIASVLSMFFLTSYGLLNVSAGLEELTSAPSWRPKFRVPWYLSIAGAFGCFATMFMINAGATFIAGFVALSVYFMMERRSLTARWGDMRSGVLMLIARNSIYALTKRMPDQRTWKPNLLVLSGAPTKRWYLIDLAGAISQDRGFLTVSAILPPDTPLDRISSFEKTVSDYLEKRDVSCVVKIYPAVNPLEGARTLSGSYGYGPISPNTIMLGATDKPEHYLQFAGFIKEIYKHKQNLVIVRESYEEIEQAPVGRRIDVWWYGTQQNLGLLLALVYLLKRSSSWKKSELVLKTIVKNAEDRQDTLDQLETFIDEVRLSARAEVLVQVCDDIFDDIRNLSRGADLVFLGMRAPNEEESDIAYSEYYKSLMDNTKGLPPTALVLAAEEMDYYAIFEED